jgi:hypothetical protein
MHAAVPNKRVKMADERLIDGIAAFRAGNKAAARKLFADLVESDDANELAWLWLAACEDTPERKKRCLQRVLAINPGHTNARSALAELEQRPEPTLDELMGDTGIHPPPGHIAESAAQPYSTAAANLGAAKAGLALKAGASPLASTLATYNVIRSSRSSNLVAWSSIGVVVIVLGMAFIAVGTSLVKKPSAVSTGVIPIGSAAYTPVAPANTPKPLGIVIVSSWRLEILEIHSDPGLDASHQTVVVIGNLFNDGVKTDSFSPAQILDLQDSAGRGYEYDSPSTVAAERKYGAESPAAISPGASRYAAFAWAVPSSEKTFILVPGSLAAGWKGDLSFTLP